MMPTQQLNHVWASLLNMMATQQSMFLASATFAVSGRQVCGEEHVLIAGTPCILYLCAWLRWTSRKASFTRVEERAGAHRPVTSPVSTMALHAAARSGDVEAGLTIIKERGAKVVDEEDKLQRTPLHLACWAGKSDFCKMLLENE